MNKFTYTDFYNQWLNQSSNLGGNYNQCVTLFKEFLNKAGYPNPSRAIGGSGGARELWYRRDALGYGDYFEYTQVGRPGDWFIWDSVYGWWQGIYYGHVAMLIKDNGNGTGQFLGMNQAYSEAPASIQTLTYNGSCGVLRYKGYNTSSYSDSKLVNEHAIAVLTADVNKRAGSPTGSVVTTLKTGTRIEYTQKYVGDGHRYISWVEGGTRYFVAVSGSEAQGVDPWATFESVKEPELELTQEDGVATLTVDCVRARLNSPTGDVVRTYNTGDKIRYTHKYVGNGHRYIVWTEGGNKIFLAVAGTEDRSDMWATFGSPDEVKEDTKEDIKEPEPETQNPEFIKNVKGYGVDISEHQGTNFDITPYDFVIIRASWGTNTDKYFETNVKKCEEAGIPYGVYCYAYPLNDSDAVSEAKYILDLIKDKDVKLGIWYDMEVDNYKKQNNVWNKQVCTSACKAFCDYIKSKGYYTGVYSASSFFGNYIDTEYPKWIAQWKGETEFIYEDLSDKCDVFQYTSMGGQLDRDVIYKDVSYFASNPVKEEPIPPTPEEPKEDKPEEPKKDEEVKPSEPVEEPKDDKSDDKKEDEKPSEEINGLSALINLLIELVKKILNIFK